MDPKPAPKPGDPDWVPRHPPLDLTPIRARVAERRTYVGPAKEAVDADTEMMEDLLCEVQNLRLANHILQSGEAPFDWKGTR